MSGPSYPQSETFSVTGKASFRTRELDQALRFRWQQKGGIYDIWLWGALGAGRTHLSGTQETLTVRSGRGNEVSGKPAQIMREHLGWSVPLVAMDSWLNGTVTQALPVAGQKLDETDRLIAVTQAGWRIRFTDFAPYRDQWKPSRITINGADLTLEIIVSRPRASMETTERRKEV